jgi:hypothetical protein
MAIGSYNPGVFGQRYGLGSLSGADYMTVSLGYIGLGSMPGSGSTPGISELASNDNTRWLFNHTQFAEPAEPIEERPRKIRLNDKPN